MKTSILFLALTQIIFLAHSQKIDFVDNDFAKAKALAEKKNKIIFVDAYADWCGPCKKMNAEVFTDASVADFYNKEFINLKIDVESAEGIEFQNDYPVEAMPTLYYINPDGSIAKVRVGFEDAGSFLQLGKDVLDPENSHFYKMTQKYKAGQKDKDFLYDYILVLEEEGQETQEVVEAYFEGLPVEQLDSLKTFAIFTIYEVGVESEYAVYFAENYDRFVEEYGKYANNKLISIISVDLNIAVENEDKKQLEKIYDFVELIFDDEETIKSLKADIEDAYDQSV